jgi:3-dehydroquinate dehydratase/shikimate dehydrogenase
MRSTPARILKIAVQANDVTDCLKIFSILEQARKDGREMIAVAMGTAGVPTRVLGPSRGAFLTYGALNVGDATAPGQITASELRHLYRIDKITAQTQVVGLVGLPVAQSVSPQMHNAAFAFLNVDALYMPFEVHDLAAFMKRMTHPRSRELDWNLRGLSITAPYKSQIIEWLDWIDLPAKEVGAINTIVIENGMLRGYNTDVIGFIKPLMQKFGNLREARCALIGAGGAAKAVLSGLRQHGSNTTVFARDVKKAAPLADKFGARLENLSNAQLKEFDVIINTTPLGMRGPFQEETPLRCDQIRGARLAYDLVYNPGETRFLREAREAGCETLGGLGMFLAQADEQFRLWTGLEPPQHVMRDAAVEALEGIN